jgi:hypothetical protein
LGMVDSGVSPTERDGIDLADPWAAAEACYAQAGSTARPRHGGRLRLIATVQDPAVMG